MPSRSPSSRLIDRILATGPSPFLKGRGYRKLARSFHAPAGELFKVVQFQASQWNSPESARFTINLMIAWPYFHETWSGRPFPKNPASATPVLTQRIGCTLPEARDHWWEVTPDVEVDALAAQVTQALSEGGLPFLEGCADLRVITESAKQKGGFDAPLNPSLRLAVLLSARGQSAEATQIIQELAAGNTHARFGATIDGVAQRLGLEVATRRAKARPGIPSRGPR